MPFYQDLTTGRTTQPDALSLLAALRALDASAGVSQFALNVFRVKKATAWTAPQIAAAQNALDTASASTPQLTAQAAVDALSLVDKARDLALIDQLNVIRNLLSPPKTPDITPAQAIAAIRAKAGTL
jgi:hypothetical protein